MLVLRAGSKCRNYLKSLLKIFINIFFLIYHKGIPFFDFPSTSSTFFTRMELSICAKENLCVCYMFNCRCVKMLIYFERRLTKTAGRRWVQCIVVCTSADSEHCLAGSKAPNDRDGSVTGGEDENRNEDEEWD